MTIVAIILSAFALAAAVLAVFEVRAEAASLRRALKDHLARIENLEQRASAAESLGQSYERQREDVERLRERAERALDEIQRHARR